jgi:hypothetical protein
MGMHDARSLLNTAIYAIRNDPEDSEEYKKSIKFLEAIAGLADEQMNMLRDGREQLISGKLTSY